MIRDCRSPGKKSARCSPGFAAAAARAVAEVEDDMILALGSGSTAALAVEAVAARMASGLFIGLASKITVGRPTGVEVIDR
jgi:ribose 5-phosphate isomerase